MYKKINVSKDLINHISMIHTLEWDEPISLGLEYMRTYMGTTLVDVTYDFHTFLDLYQPTS